MDLIRAADQDHFERTRHSFVLDGVEHGYVKPTAATEARLRPDPIERMVANETLSRARGDAAAEIREIFERLVAGLWSRALDLSSSRGGGGLGPSDRIATLHATRYLPWAFYLGGEPAGPATSKHPGQQSRIGRCPPALVLAIDMVVEGRGLAECAADRAMHWTTAARLLSYALAVYADLAGWERNRDEVAAAEAWWRRRRR